MIPDLDLQLQAVIKALRDTVLPALDAAQTTAAEQLGLSIATLTMVRERLPDMPAREWADLAEAIAHGSHVATLTMPAGLDDALARGQELLEAPCPPAGAVATARRDILALVSEAVESAPADQAMALMRAVVTGAARSTAIARSWSKGAGFEPAPSEIPDFATLAAR
jgi:hypothetical protein